MKTRRYARTVPGGGAARWSGMFGESAHRRRASTDDAALNVRASEATVCAWFKRRRGMSVCRRVQERHYIAKGVLGLRVPGCGHRAA